VQQNYGENVTRNQHANFVIPGVQNTNK